MTRIAITVDTEDPVFQVWRWRYDSMRMFILQPILDLALDIPEQPCVLGERYACRPQSCSPCLVYDLQDAMTRSIQ
jgi:hypothetical protein